MKILNDQIIVSDLQSNVLWGKQYNYYVYAYMMPGTFWFFGLGGFAAILTKLYILNFNEQGMGVLGINVGGNVIDGHIQMLPYRQIRQMTVKSSFITFGLSVILQITLDDNTTLNMRVSRYVTTIKQQGPNLQNIKNLFSNGVPQAD